MIKRNGAKALSKEEAQAEVDALTAQVANDDKNIDKNKEPERNKTPNVNSNLTIIYIYIYIYSESLCPKTYKQ